MRIQRTNPKLTVEEVELEEVDLSLIDPLIKKYGSKKGSLIPILQGTQDIYGYVPEGAFYKISKETGLRLNEMYGVATFYAQFRLRPVGKNIIKVCHGTACHVQNATELTESLEAELKVKDGETTADNLFTLESVACLGCCSLAPAMMIGDDTFGKLNGKKAVDVIREIRTRETGTPCKN
ncbi:MAG: NADH-quinone oxidoreductase subunit NuoE [Bacteroidota bacterium]